MKRSNLEKQYLHALNLVLNAEFPGALALLDRLSAAVPKDPRLIYGKAACLFMLGRADEAVTLCERLTVEFKDPRGRRLQAAFSRVAGSAAVFEDVKAESGTPYKRTGRLRKWLKAGALTGAVILVVLLWFAYPIIVRVQQQGGQLPSLASDTGRAAFVAPNPPGPRTPEETPNSPAPEPVAGDSDQAMPDEANPAIPEEAPKPTGNTPSLALHLTHMVRELGRGVSGALSDKALPPWKVRLAPMELPPFPKGPVSSVIELQPYRTEETLTNDKGDSVKLINLNPLVGAWYVLEFNVGDKKQSFHLEVFPLESNRNQKPRLALYADGLVVLLEKETQYFPLWPEQLQTEERKPPDYASNKLNAAPVLSDAFKTIAAIRSPMGLICSNMVIVRQQRPGSTSKIELATDILRETRVGDWLVEKLKPMLIRPPEAATSQASLYAVPVERAPEAPLDALVAPDFAKLAHKPKLLGIETDAADGNMVYGHWYHAVHHAGMYVSLLAPSAIDGALMASYPDRVAPLGGGSAGSAEEGSVVYLLAIDMEQYGFGFALGADHPNVEWSIKARKGSDMDGPDGFGTHAPLVTIGAVPPCLMNVMEGVFAGGFKREHGAFAAGPFSKVNNNSHFGFAEEGVVFSRLNPGLATAIIAPDGSMNLLTWPENGDADFRYILHARQNGVPIVEGTDANGVSIPGEFVKKPGDGAWSGNASGRLLTIRAGMGIQEHDGHRFLLLGYFTGATPNAMARVYQAYRCRYAMSLDMNAPELTYSAFYLRGSDGKIEGAEYLVKDMRANHLRFLQTNDTRDCFYLFHR